MKKLVCLAVVLVMVLVPAVVFAQEFSFDVPPEIYVNEEVTVPVTFTNGDEACDAVRFEFEATGPGDVTFKATDSEEVEHEFINSGFWGPSTGFPLTEGYYATTDWTLSFSAAGDYEITFRLMNLDGESEICSDGVTVTVLEEGEEEPENGENGEKPKSKKLPKTGGTLIPVLLGGMLFAGGYALLRRKK